MPSILIVCTANICRSPMAEAILKHLVAGRVDVDQWSITSAGTWARYGAPAAVLSQQTMQEMGLDVSAHQSKPVTEELISHSDLILTMEGQQKEGLKLQYELYTDRIFMLSEMVGRVEDVLDPIGGELADYQATAKILEKFLAGGLERIRRLARKHNIQSSA